MLQEVSPLLYADAALEAFWPNCGLSPMSENDRAPEARRARDMLTRGEWVPCLSAQQDSSAGSRGAGGSGGTAGAGQQTAQQAQQAQQQGRRAQVEPLSMCAESLQEILEQLAARDASDGLGAIPSLADVRRWALLLWLGLASDRLQQGAPDAPHPLRLLTAIQLGLSSGLLRWAAAGSVVLHTPR